MKPLYTFLFLACFTIPVLSQELNFNDLIYLYNNRLDLAKCDTYLSKRNFTYLEYADNIYTFTFKRLSEKTAEAFLFLSTKYVMLQSVKRSTFDYFKEITSSYGLFLDGTGILENGALNFTYRSKEYYLSLSQSLDEGGSGVTVYTAFFVINKP